MWNHNSWLFKILILIVFFLNIFRKLVAFILFLSAENDLPVIIWNILDLSMSEYRRVIHSSLSIQKPYKFSQNFAWTQCPLLNDQE